MWGLQKHRRAGAYPRVEQRKCPGEESNLHALAGTGPQPAAYAYSATGALVRYYTPSKLFVNWLPVAY